MPQMTSYRHGVPCWIDVSAPDVEATSRFYAALFGWTIEPDMGPDGGGYRMIAKNGSHVGGIGPLMQEGAPPSWVTYFSVDDVDAAMARVEPAGGSVAVPPMDLPFGSGRIGMALDAAGGFFAMFQRGPNHFGAQVCNEVGTLTWSELTSRDADRNLAFYGDVLGWTTETVDMGEMGPYHLIQVSGRSVAGCMQMDESFPDDMPTHWMTYFAVGDVDATCAQCTELGGAVPVPPFDTPVGKMAVLTDPNGAVFSIGAFNEIDDPNAW
jgi:uncharacterized protein